MTSTSPLPLIPAPRDLASDIMRHRVDDLLFNPPCAQNEWGHVQCANSITAFTAQQFPPLLANSMTETPWWPIFMPTCECFLDGRLLAARPRPAGLIEFQWFPHQVERRTEVESLSIRTELFLPPLRRVAAMRIQIQNNSDRRRTGTIGFSLVGNVAKANFNINGRPGFLGSAAGGYADDPDALPLAEPLCETDNEAIALPEEGGILFRARHSNGWCMQGFSRRPIATPQNRQAEFEYTLAAGATDTFFFVSALGEDRESAQHDCRDVLAKFDAIQEENHSRWAQRLTNVYTPGNAEYSGHLPTLETTDKALWKLYHMGMMTALFCRTASPASVFGPTYLAVRGQQRPSRVYIWDASLASRCLALLDPVALRRLLEQWFLQHPDRHMDLDFVTGKSVENHYATNQMMLVYAAQNYLEVTQDYAWLDSKIGKQTVLDHLLSAALFWKGRQDRQGWGLVDHSESDLLEVVSTYHGVVAALQAGNVYAMRFVASLYDKRGRHTDAEDLRLQASSLAKRTIEHLYVEGSGVWRAVTRDGTAREVRHCYDYLTVLDLMADDLSAEQRKEMLDFFWSELAGECWIYALSPRDPDAAWNRRADHTWCGSYPGWPAVCAEIALRFDPSDRTTQWVRSLARSANQGPFGQAHMMPGPFPDESGGAQKAPLVMPLLAEWAALSGARFTGTVIDAVFGTVFSGSGAVQQKNCRVHHFDPGAKLHHVWKGNSSFTVSAHGVQTETTTL
ncbi:MAG: hypothetical protein ABIZ04_17895 [Opitutus sp.]